MLVYGIFGGRVPNFDQPEARKHCFLASDWLKFETLSRKYHTLLPTSLLSEQALFQITNGLLRHKATNYCVGIGKGVSVFLFF